MIFKKKKLAAIIEWFDFIGLGNFSFRVFHNKSHSCTGILRGYSWCRVTLTATLDTVTIVEGLGHGMDCCGDDKRLETTAVNCTFRCPSLT
jgi:hypothetical protein